MGEIILGQSPAGIPEFAMMREQFAHSLLQEHSTVVICKVRCLCDKCLDELDAENWRKIGKPLDKVRPPTRVRTHILEEPGAYGIRSAWISWRVTGSFSKPEKSRHRGIAASWPISLLLG